MPPRACSSPLVSCRRPSSHRFRTVVLRAVDFALSPFVLLISYRWLRDAARDVCAVSLPNAFLGVSVLDFHSRIAGLAGFSVCASLISGLTCDLGRQVSSELAFSVSWPVCATPISGPIPDLCRRKIRLMQTRNRGCADPNQPRCSGNSCAGSCAGRLADNCARRLCGRSCAGRLADTEMGPTSGTTGERENYKNHVKCDNQRNNYHIDREFHRTIHIIAH